MANKLQSSSSSGATRNNFLVPGGSQFILYFLISILLLILLNIKKTWDYLNQTVLKPEGGLDGVIANNAPGIHKVISSITQSIILQVLFWIFVGCVVYMTIWFIKNIAINLVNDVTADQYVHPLSYKRYKFWGSILARRTFFWISSGVLVFFLAVSARLIIDLSGLCYDAVTDFAFIQSLLNIAGSLLAVTSIIYLGVLLVHVVMTSWQIMYKDL
jgi:hypothetical protein